MKFSNMCYLFIINYVLKINYYCFQVYYTSEYFTRIRSMTKHKFICEQFTSVNGCNSKNDYSFIICIF